MLNRESNTRVELFFDRLDLAKYFPVVVSGDDVEHGKPAPDLFLLAAENLGVETQDCIVIEDAANGVKAAKAAGMKCLGFAGLPHNHEDLSGADVIVTDFKALADYVRRGGRLLEFA